MGADQQFTAYMKAMVWTYAADSCLERRGKLALPGQLAGSVHMYTACAYSHLQHTCERSIDTCIVRCTDSVLDRVSQVVMFKHVFEHTCGGFASTFAKSLLDSGCARREIPTY